MATMQALVADERGGPEELRMATVPRPEPGPGEVLVEVHAAAITFAELGWPESWTHRPMIPSHEMSGVVAARGPGVTDLPDGDQVFGLIRFDRLGAAAEYVTVPADDLASDRRAGSRQKSARRGGHRAAHPPGASPAGAARHLDRTPHPR